MFVSHIEPHAPIRGLRRQWSLTAAFYILFTGALAWLLGRVWGSAYSLRWLGVSTLTLLYLLSMLWQRLSDNRPDDEAPLYPNLGLANHLSILRGVLLAYLAGFILLPRPTGWLGWAAGTLYTGAIVIDYADGMVARLTQHPSRLGAWLDTNLDALGILVAPALGMAWEQLPPWYALVALAYYLFIGGVWLRRRRQLPVYDLPPSAIRRPLAGIQMGFISAILWPVLAPPLTWWAATLVMIPFVAGFLRDWLVVSGWIDPRSERYQSVTRQVSLLVGRWLPVGLRIGIAGSVAFFGWRAVTGGTLSLYGALSPLTAAWIALLALLTVTGMLGRLAATLLAIFVGLAMMRGGMHPATWIVMGCSLALMLLGTGAWSIWQPEEIFLQSHYGGKES
jgi:CDP-diacylglycerol--glycerol-3-phosphate 3-phosphatidyltransferase